jgi:hypothetical protein
LPKQYFTRRIKLEIPAFCLKNVRENRRDICRDTGNIEHTKQDENKQNKTQKTKKMSNTDTTKTRVNPGAREG